MSAHHPEIPKQDEEGIAISMDGENCTELEDRDQFQDGAFDETLGDQAVAAVGTRSQRPVPSSIVLDPDIDDASHKSPGASNRLLQFATQQLPNIPFRPATKPPKETLKAVYDAGRYKAGLTLNVLIVQSFMAGFYIAMAGQLFISVGGGFLGAAMFPTGLIAVVLTSGELFTGDALVFVASWLGGHIKAYSLVRNWTVSWCGNFLGCLVWASMLGYGSDALTELDRADLAVKIALKKAYQPYLSTFLKGIGANLMVCVGVWQATCAEEVAGKVLALWFPITGFVAMGFDHCIANQFFLPLGMMLGADISMGRMLGALLVASLGNVVGGGLFVGAVYWYVFDSLQTTQSVGARIRLGMNRASSMLVHKLGHNSQNTPSPETSGTAATPTHVH